MLTFGVEASGAANSSDSRAGRGKSGQERMSVAAIVDRAVGRLNATGSEVTSREEESDTSGSELCKVIADSRCVRLFDWVSYRKLS